MKFLFVSHFQKPGRRQLIHCLDGVEKTGLFLSAYNLQQKKQIEDSIDVAWSVLSAKDANLQFVSGSQHVKFLFEFVKFLKNA